MFCLRKFILKKLNLRAATFFGCVGSHLEAEFEECKMGIRTVAVTHF
jgi:hypothetical protein